MDRILRRYSNVMLRLNIICLNQVPPLYSYCCCVVLLRCVVALCCCAIVLFLGSTIEGLVAKQLDKVCEGVGVIASVETIDVVAIVAIVTGTHAYCLFYENSTKYRSNNCLIIAIVGLVAVDDINIAYITLVLRLYYI